MRIRSILVAVLLAAAVPMSASQSKLYPAYETARQALIRASVPEIRKATKQLVAVAQSEKRPEIAARAEAVVRAANLKAARGAFAALSDEMIRFRASDRGQRPVVAYCSMEKKSWLQPAGEIGNPYVDAGMRKCGEVKAR